MNWLLALDSRIIRKVRLLKAMVREFPQPLRRLPCFFSMAAVSLASFACSVSAEDWNQWNGPSRDGRIREEGLPTAIGPKGLTKNWSTPIAGGYSGPSVSKGIVVVSDYLKLTGESTNNPGGRDKLTGKERVHGIDAKSGEIIWSRDYDRDYKISYASGPRANPTIDGDRVYALGAEGDLLCLTLAKGEIVWKRQLRDEYKTETPDWGYSSHPLVVDGMVVTLAGGPGSVVVALDKNTGKEVWRALTASSIGYAPPMVLEHEGTRHLMVWDADNINALDIKTGKVLWSTPLKPSYSMSIMSPVKSGNKLFASGIGTVSSLFELGPKGDSIKPLWKGDTKNSMYCSNVTPIFDGDYLYGCDCERGTLMCVRASDGKRLWETGAATAGNDRPGRHASAFLAKSKDAFYILADNGDFIIAKLTPEKYEELGRTHVIDPTNDCFGRPVVWSYPAFADGQLFVRNDREINCFQLK